MKQSDLQSCLAHLENAIQELQSAAKVVYDEARSWREDVFTTADPKWLTPVPVGYDTVVGYLAKHHPEVLEFKEEAPDATSRDGYWLAHRCRERNLDRVRVPAPPIFHQNGIDFVWAWPTSLLRERFAGEREGA